MRRLLLPIAVLGLVSCASTTLETPSDHPANPSANPARLQSSPETLQASFDPFVAYGVDVAGSTPARSSGPAPGPSETSRAQPPHQPTPSKVPAKPTPSAAPAYTCPMHPEIVRDAPGKCPICGMNLVPKKPETEQPAH